MKFLNEGKDTSSITNNGPTRTVRDLTYQLGNAGKNKLYLTLTPDECKRLAIDLRKMDKEFKLAKKELKKHAEAEG